MRPMPQSGTAPALSVLSVARGAERCVAIPAHGHRRHFGGGDCVANVMWMSPAMRAASIT